jgi:2,4-dienoyl-CoA reductase-like NADH-dependent reductase (Old Yellow Enzyme family)
MENRFRFVREVIEAVREVIPQDRLLIVRVSNWGIADMDVSLFENKAQWQEMIRLFDAQPIDAISVSTYDYAMDAFGSGHTMAALTRQVTTLPLMICGKIHDRKTAEDAFRDADIVLSGKSSLLNPDWVQDLRDGKEMPAHKSEDANVAYTTTPLP